MSQEEESFKYYDDTTLRRRQVCSSGYPSELPLMPKFKSRQRHMFFKCNSLLLSLQGLTTKASERDHSSEGS